MLVFISLILPPGSMKLNIVPNKHVVPFVLKFHKIHESKPVVNRGRLVVKKKLVDRIPHSSIALLSTPDFLKAVKIYGRNETKEIESKQIVPRRTSDAFFV